MTEYKEKDIQPERERERERERENILSDHKAQRRYWIR